MSQVISFILISLFIWMISVFNARSVYAELFVCDWDRAREWERTRVSEHLSPTLWFWLLLLFSYCFLLFDFIWFIFVCCLHANGGCCQPVCSLSAICVAFTLVSLAALFLIFIICLILLCENVACQARSPQTLQVCVCVCIVLILFYTNLFELIFMPSLPLSHSG